MSQKKITDLTLRSSVTDELNIPSDDGIQSYRVTAAQLKAYMESLFPAGLIAPYAGTTVPDKWLACDGSAVSRTTYSGLFAAIGTTWGVGNGTTTFNLPDLRGRTTIGDGTGSGLTARTLGASLGNETHALSIPELPTHAHNITDPGHAHTAQRVKGSGASDGFFNDGIVQSGSYSTATASTGITTTQNAGSGSSHNNMQPSAVVKYMIRTGV